MAQPTAMLREVLYQPEVTFGVDPGGWVASGIFVPLLEDIPDMAPTTREMFEDPTIVQNAYPRSRLPGALGGAAALGASRIIEFEMRHYMIGLSAAVPVLAPSVAGLWLPQFFAQALGGNDVSGLAPTTVSGAASTAVRVDCTSLAAASPGGIYGIAMTSGYAARFAKSINVTAVPDELQTHADCGYPEIPATGAAVYAPATVYHRPFDIQTTRVSYAFLMSGHDTQARRLLLGCQCVGWQIRWKYGQFPEVTTRWRAAACVRTGVAAILPRTWAQPVCEQWRDQFCMLTDGADAIPMRVSELTLDYDGGIVARKDPHGLHASAATWDAVAIPKATVQLDPLGTSAGTQDDLLEGWREDQTALHLEAIAGSQPGRFMGIRMPGARIIDFTPMGNREGFHSTPLTLEWSAYTGDTMTGAVREAPGFSTDSALAVSFC